MVHLAGQPGACSASQSFLAWVKRNLSWTSRDGLGQSRERVRVPPVLPEGVHAPETPLTNRRGLGEEVPVEQVPPTRTNSHCAPDYTRDWRRSVNFVDTK
jgi:hypothetical protein